MDDVTYEDSGLRKDLYDRAGILDLEKANDFRTQATYQQIVTDVTGSLGIWGITLE